MLANLKVTHQLQYLVGSFWPNKYSFASLASDTIHIKIEVHLAHQLAVQLPVWLFTKRSSFDLLL
uniref:Uncharacterized protein n=1 Tax=Anguilla anguilla TaxID=7936 RepID=A0A0E9WXL8_ANGAN